MKTKINLSTGKLISIGLLSLVALYYIILLATRKPQLPAEVKAQLDSLNRVTQQLQANQVKYDSTIHSQEEIIEGLDTHINTIKEKTVIIKEFYHEQSQAASKYTPTQIDSFFKARYGY